MKSLLTIGAFAITLFGCGSTGSDNYTGEEGDFKSDNYADSDSAEFCPVGAFYDESDDFCYIDCDDLSDGECDALEEEVFGDFDEFIDDDYAGRDVADFEEGELVAQYEIQDDLTLSVLENNEPQSDAKFKAIWAGANKILPRSKVLSSFSEFHVNTDGLDGNLAYVTIDENQPGMWIVAFDDADYVGPTDREFIHTTIHEFGHVVFLGQDQLDPEIIDECPRYGLDEGCSFETSYINQFYKQFWAEIIDEHAALESEGQQMAFYEKYKERFVSDYAMTNPVEDAAEIFTHFVLREKPANADTVVKQKILMLYDFKDLVKLRNDIRGKLTITRARIKKAG